MCVALIHIKHDNCAEFHLNLKVADAGRSLIVTVYTILVCQQVDPVKKLTAHLGTPLGVLKYFSVSNI